MRDQLLARVQPVVADLADQLVTILLEKVEGLVDQMRGAFDVALSSFASDLDLDRADGLAPPELYRGRVKRIEDIVGLDSFVPKTAPKATPRKKETTTTGKPRERAVMRCKKCGELGKRSDSCGKTHNVSTSPAEEEESDEAIATPARAASGKTTRTPATSPIKTPPPSRSVDRFSLIEARAEKRRDREEGRTSRRGASGMEPGDGSEGGVDRPVRTDPEPEVEMTVSTRSTFVVDPM